MFRRILIISLLLLAGLTSNGQQDNGFRYADSLTYSLYMEKNWNELVSEGRKAIGYGHDYYYMRMRIGIAFYERRNYAMSAIHFKKALDYNNDDQVALEYLFYSYFLSGRSWQAWSLMNSFFPENRERILKESRLKHNTISLESFISDTKTGGIISDPDIWFADPEPGSQIVTDYFLNNSILASHQLGTNVNYFHAYTNLIKQNYLHYYDGSYSYDLDPQSVIQNQYYGSLSFFTSGGWSFSPAFHLIRSSYNSVYFATQGMNVNVIEYKSNLSGFYGGINVSKATGFLTLGLEAGYISFNTVQNFQGTLSAVIYPLGNSELYFGGSISTIRKSNDPGAPASFTEGAMAGFSVARRIWIELSVLSGYLDHFAGNNGLYIYNSADILRNKIFARIIIPFHKAGLTLYGGAGMSAYYSNFKNFDGEVSSSSNRINYISINYTGGLSWNF